jgi:hypothetical protein
MSNPTSIYTKSVTIANSATESDAVQLCGDYNDDVNGLVGIVTAAGLTTANFTFLFSLDNSTFIQPKNAAGTALTITNLAASEWRAVDPTDFLGAKYIKLVSSASQSSGDVITLVLRGVA